MTIYRVSYAIGTDDASHDGSTWAADKCIKTFKYAVESKATTNGDIIYLDDGHADELAADTTITFAADIQVLCVDKDNSDALSTGAVIGAQASTAYGIITGGAKRVYFRGVTMRVPGSTNKNIALGTNSDNLHYEFELCRFELTTTGTTCYINVGTASWNTYVRLIDCVFKFGATNQRIGARTGIEMVGCSIDATGSQPGSTSAIEHNGRPGVARLVGCDWSHVSGTLISSDSTGLSEVVLENCKLPASFTMLQSQTSIASKGTAQLWAYNCASGDTHYALEHRDSMGTTTVSTSIYITSTGASYDGTNRCSWVVDGSANASFNTPYCSPWIEVYHAGTSAITPYIEVMRDNSSGAVYDNDEVWAEWSYQGTSGSTRATVDRDRMTPNGTPAAQTASALSGSDWTGETGTAGYFKIGPGASITPAEIGPLKMRVCVAGDFTVYVDPQIRGLS